MASKLRVHIVAMRSYYEATYFDDTTFQSLVKACANAGWILLPDCWDGRAPRVRVRKMKESKKQWIPFGNEFKLDAVISRTSVKNGDNNLFIEVLDA